MQALARRRKFCTPAQVPQRRSVTDTKTARLREVCQQALDITERGTSACTSCGQRPEKVAFAKDSLEARDPLRSVLRSATTEGLSGHAFAPIALCAMTGQVRQ